MGPLLSVLRDSLVNVNSLLGFLQIFVIFIYFILYFSEEFNCFESFHSYSDILHLVLSANYLQLLVLVIFLQISFTFRLAVAQLGRVGHLLIIY